MKNSSASLLARLALCGLVLAIPPFPDAVAADAGLAPTAEQKRSDEGVQAYVKKSEQDQEKARDEAIRNNTAKLLRDPRTPIVGNSNGDVAIVEFFDYACPYCKAAEPRLEKLIKDDKRLKIVLKEFPILTPESVIAAKASLASAKQGKYQAFHEALMGFKGRLEISVIFDTAKTVGLDVARLRRDMDAPEISDQIIGNFNLARALRIFETPSFIVGGHMLTEPSAEIDFPKVVAAARQK